MKFRVTIEQYIPECPNCAMEYGGIEKPYWKVIQKEEIKIAVAERAARMIEQIVQDEGLTINANELRGILFEELHEKE